MKRFACTSDAFGPEVNDLARSTLFSSIVKPDCEANDAVPEFTIPTLPAVPANPSFCEEDRKTDAAHKKRFGDEIRQWKR
ncbi:2162_t:CDS:2 [Rhizophagus irregularis]|nr:2162_t:CDS:2 [Rhizophagus irregularis]